MQAIQTSENPPPMTAPRSPWLAVVLSLVATGVGQVYCGRTLRGLFLFSVWLLLLPCCLIATQLQPSSVLLWGLVALPFVVVVAVFVFACVDAFRLARQCGASYRLCQSNRLTVYVALLWLGATYPILTMNSIRSHCYEAFVMAENSMQPVLRPGDRVLANKARVSAGELPDRSAIVVFRSPEQPGVHWVKRVVGLPGDRVRFSNGVLSVNGVPVGETPPSAVQSVPDDTSEWLVPDHEVFLVGDNLPNSKDSRHFGSIRGDQITGVLEYIFFAADTWRRLGVPSSP